MKPTKTQVVQELTRLLGFEPTQTEDRPGVFNYEKHGVFLCEVSGKEDNPQLSTSNSGWTVQSLDFTWLSELKPRLELVEKANHTTCPTNELELTSFYYYPGDKWSCGKLDLDATTSLGELLWREVLPGPRHSEDSHELTVTLNGVEVDVDEYFPLDFEAPGKPGKWADLFAASEDEVEQTLQAWYEANRLLLATLVS